MLEFSDRVAVVTGSSSGIGEAIAHRLSQLGATVVVNSASSVEAGEAVSDALPGESTYIRADISLQHEGHALIDETIARYGRLDYLINNAGWTTVVPHRQLEALSDDIFRKTFEVNVFGTWWLTKHAIPHLLQSDDPCIVTITSIAALRPVGSSMAYSMAKAALNQMTLLLAKSYGPIRVNALAPGLVGTPWTAEWTSMHAGVAARSPISRSATPEDCAEATLALLRNKYATGEIFVLDGGLSLST